MNLSYFNLWYLFTTVITTVYLVLLMDKNNDDQNISGLPPKKFVKFVLMVSILIIIIDLLKNKKIYILTIWIVFIYLFNLIHENKKITKMKVITTLTIAYASIIWFIFFIKRTADEEYGYLQ